MSLFTRIAMMLPLTAVLAAPLPANATAAPPASPSWARVTIYIASASGCPSELKAGASTVGQLFD